MSDYYEGCCFNYFRDNCPGRGCTCKCHEDEAERLRQRSRDEDTARIRLNEARIKAEAERDALAAQVAALREALGLAIADLTNLSELRILTGQYRTEANELVERLSAALAAAGGPV